MICEYIRKSYYPSYTNYSPNKLDKYCKKLLRYEKTNQTKLIRYCKKQIELILNNAINNHYTKETINLALLFSKSIAEKNVTLADTLMSYACSTYIRGKHH